MLLSHTTVLRFSYPTATAAQRVERAVRVEVGELDADRSAVSVRRRDRTLALDIEAADLVALRAATNSWLRYVAVAEDVADAVEASGPER